MEANKRLDINLQFQLHLLTSHKVVMMKEYSFMATDYQKLPLKLNRTILIASGVLAVSAVLMLLFDHAVTGYTESLHFGNLSLLLRAITELGHGVTVLIVFLVLMAFYEEYHTGLTGVISQASVGIVTGILKPVFARTRPYGGGGFSFPSGHTATAFAAAVVLAHRFPRFKYIFYLLAVGVGVTRVLLDKHFPSDVLAGAAIGLVVGEISVVMCAKLETLHKQRWLRPTAFVVLIILSVYALLGSDVPRYLAPNIGPAMLLILARRTAVIHGSSGKQ